MRFILLALVLSASSIFAADAPRQPAAPPTIPVTVTKGADGSIAIAPITADDFNKAKTIAASVVDAQIASQVKARAAQLTKEGGNPTADVLAAYTVDASVTRDKQIAFQTGLIVQRSIDAALAKVK